MGKYNLTREEKEIVNKYCNYSVPFIFKSGKYCGYMQYFEFINFEICNTLLKGKEIGEGTYKKIVLEDSDYNPQINIAELDKNSLAFYNLYLLIKNLVEKYYQ